MNIKILRISTLACIIIALSLQSCTKNHDLPTKPVQINLTLKEATLVSTANSFALDIFRRVDQAAGNVNVMISPLSISYALSMTSNGAANSTRDSILKALRVKDLTIDELNQSYKDLTPALLSVDSRVNIKIANSVWAEKNFDVKQPFSIILTGYYDAEARSFDITDPTAPVEINQWISDHTNGLIKNMIDQLDYNTVMLLVNAIYFKGKWQGEFNPDATASRSFTKPAGVTTDVPTMHQTETRSVFQGDGFKMIELPYGQGNFVMDIMLPDANSLSALNSALTAENLETWTSSMASRKVDLYLPKFKYGYKVLLKDILSEMGMGIAFGDYADFSNISDLALLISEVIHQSFIETNEEGTEAAAATVVIIGTTSAGPNDPMLFDVDHQFIYIIREITTNSILFMGKVTDPLSN